MIGNSHWHWAEAGAGGLHCRSVPPGQGSVELEAGGSPPRAWAATGAVPVALDPGRRLCPADVPLAGVPPWLGVDRALAGWLAWQQSGCGVLVADAGTVLSMTRVRGDGSFAGGRLLAGAALQLDAMARATAALPASPQPPALPADGWPQPTAEAMAAGVLRGLAAAVAQAWQEARGEDPASCLWLSGGDGPALAPLLGVEPTPHLALRALVALRPAGDP